MIASLRLRDFRSYAEAGIDPEPVSIVVAPNGAGKSSLLLALEYALTGRASGVTDERGAGADWLIRQGEREAVIELDLPTLGQGVTLRRVVRRGASNRVALTGIEGGTEAVEQVLFSRLGASRDQLSVLLHMDRFLALPPAEQQDLLFAATGWLCTPESLRMALAGVPETALRLTDADSLSGGPEALDVLEKRAREQRAQAKARLARLEVDLRTASAAPELPPGVVASERPDYEATLADLVAERDELQRRIGASESAARLLDLAEARRGRLQAERDEMAAILAKPVGPRYDLERLEGRLAAVQDELNQARLALEQARGRQIEAGAELSRLQAALRDAAPDDAPTEGCCPFAPVRFPCQQVGAPAARAAIEEALGAAESAAREAAEAVRSAEGQVASRSQQLAGLTADIEEARRIAKDRGRAQERLPAINQALAEVEGEIGRLQAADTAELRADIARLDARITKGRSILAALDRAEQAAAAAQQLSRQATEVRAEVQALEALVAALGPAGAKGRILRSLCDELASEANRYLGELGGPSVRFETEGRFAVSVQVAGAWAPPAVLSRSERLRVGAALAAALAGRIGVPLLVIDDADALGPDERSLLVDWLLKLPWIERGTVLVLSVLGEVEPRDPGLDGVGVWVIDGGQIRRAPAGALEGAVG